MPDAKTKSKRRSAAMADTPVAMPSLPPPTASGRSRHDGSTLTPLNVMFMQTASCQVRRLHATRNRAIGSENVSVYACPL